jgi:hypothetical protein
VKGKGAARGHDVVRPFIMTGGRTKSKRADLRVETLVRRIGSEVAGSVPSEQRALLALTEDPVSVAELSAELGLIVSVVSVLLNDMMDARLVEVFESDPDTIDLDMLTAMVAKIRSL